ncbi:chaperone NapD [Pseudoneobacillus sp. C159]
MVISGMYIETLEGTAKKVAEQIANVEGVEVHHIEDKLNKIIITLEAETVDRSYKISDTFKLIDGVLSTCLVYTNFEEDSFYLKAADAK